jgi:hypothetical protein
MKNSKQRLKMSSIYSLTADHVLLRLGWAMCVLGGLGCAAAKTPTVSRSSDTSSTTAAASGSSSTPPAASSRTGLPGAAGASSTPNGVSVANSSAAGANSAGAPAATTALMRPPPPASGCASNALDQEGCSCDKPGATRPCYSADPKTRNVGMCKDGIQTCMGASGVGVEFGGQWGPCKEQVVPTECKEQLDARCVGKVGCADEGCATKLNCSKDAGMPDAGNRHCVNVMGWGVGTGLFADGGMWCER